MKTLNIALWFLLFSFQLFAQDSNWKVYTPANSGLPDLPLSSIAIENNDIKWIIDVKERLQKNDEVKKAREQERKEYQERIKKERDERKQREVERKEREEARRLREIERKIEAEANARQLKQQKEQMIVKKNAENAHLNSQISENNSKSTSIEIQIRTTLKVKMEQLSKQK